MAQFVFSVPSRVEFGKGKADTVGQEVAALFPGKKAKVMIVTDSGVRSAGLLTGIEAALRQVGAEIYIFDEVEPNPRDTTVHKAADLFNKNHMDAIVAVGGGSSMDLAKAVGVVAAFGGSIADYDGMGKVPGNIAPLIAIPTTSGTASEVTFLAIITNTTNHVKMGVGDHKLAPKISLVDPLMTISLPRGLTLGTGLDAMTHAVESYTSLVGSPPTDSLAIQAIELIAANLPVAVENGRDEDAREGMMLGSLLAGMSFGNADCGIAHSLSESVGAVFDAPHGMTNGILLPYVMAFNLPACPEKFANMAAAMKAHHSPEAAVNMLWDMEQSFKMPGLSDFGVQPEDFNRLAQMAMEHPCTLSNPRQPEVEDLVKILALAHKRSQVQL